MTNDNPGYDPIAFELELEQKAMLSCSISIGSAPALLTQSTSNTAPFVLARAPTAATGFNMPELVS